MSLQKAQLVNSRLLDIGEVEVSAENWKLKLKITSVHFEWWIRHGKTCFYLLFYFIDGCKMQVLID